MLLKTVDLPIILNYRNSEIGFQCISYFILSYTHLTEFDLSKAQFHFMYWYWLDLRSYRFLLIIILTTSISLIYLNVGQHSKSTRWYDVKKNKIKYELIKSVMPLLIEHITQ